MNVFYRIDEWDLDVEPRGALLLELLKSVDEAGVFLVDEEDGAEETQCALSGGEEVSSRLAAAQHRSHQAGPP